MIMLQILFRLNFYAWSLQMNKEKLEFLRFHGRVNYLLDLKVDLTPSLPLLFWCWTCQHPDLDPIFGPEPIQRLEW